MLAALCCSVFFKLNININIWSLENWSGQGSLLLIRFCFFNMRIFCLMKSQRINKFSQFILSGTCTLELTNWQMSDLSSSLHCVQPLWRFTSAPPDGRLLIYRSEDIRNLSRLHQPSVCGYVTSDPSHLLPDIVKTAVLEEQEEEGQYILTLNSEKWLCWVVAISTGLC